MSRKTILLYIIMFSCLLFSGCGSDTRPPSSAASDPAGKKLRDSTPRVFIPTADGKEVYQNDLASIDASNLSQGYIMVDYLGACPKVMVQITGPSETTYSCLIPDKEGYSAFPLVAGNGSYSVKILENVGEDSYILALSQNVNVRLENEFLPFLYSNQYVDFTASSSAVNKSKALSEGAFSDLDVVNNVYHYLIENIVYDTQKAETVSPGYLPDVEGTLSSGKGICFDYAALMAAMLRSQNIPTKLEIGYSGPAYHAWISTYVNDIGWIDGIIQFDGTSWVLMDPTLAASNDARAVGEYIGDGSNYIVKYSY